MRRRSLLLIFLILMPVVSKLVGNVGPQPTPEVYVDPPSVIELAKVSGTYFTVTINITGVTSPGVNIWDFKLRFNPNLLYTNETMITEGTFLNSIGSTGFTKTVHEDYIQVGCMLLTPDGATGSGILATVIFNVTALGESLLDLYDTRLFASDSSTIFHTAADGYFRNVESERIPVASFAYSPADPKWYENVTFDASASSDPDGTIVSYKWHFGRPYENFTVVTDPITHYRYPRTVEEEQWNYTVRLIVIDNEGITGNVAVKVITITSGPIASFTYSPMAPLVGETVTFNASASYVPDGWIDNYDWDFGDGNTDSGEVVTHAYMAAGTYNVNLTVTDNLGKIDSTIKSIMIGRPIASFTFAPMAPLVGETAIFNASDSKPVVGTIISYTWDFGDGNITAVTNPIINHTYTMAGTYTVTLNVTDSEGLWDVESKFITVRSPPVASFTYLPEVLLVGETVTFNGSASASNGGTIISYVWNFGDGNITAVTNPIINHVYTSHGAYTVTLTVTDSDELWDIESKSITVKSYPMAAFTYSPALPIVNEAVTFNASTSIDPDGTIVSYRWNFGDGNTTAVDTLMIKHVFATSGNFNVTLTVEDNEGLTNATTKSIIVQAEPEPEPAPSTPPHFVAGIAIAIVAAIILIYFIRFRKS